MTEGTAGRPEAGAGAALEPAGDPAGDPLFDRTPWPRVTVFMTVRNEERHLGASVAGALAQDYPGEVEIVLAVGPSRDGTARIARDLAAAHPAVKVVANRTGRTPDGLNAAVAASTGDVLARVDGHAVLPPGYLRRAVEVLRETGAANVGGVMAAEGTTPFEAAVAAAMTSPFGVGGGRFHYGGDPGPADTVYLGVFRRAALLRTGGYDEAFARAQDWELNHRLRGAGEIVWFTPDLRVTYHPRASLRALGTQYRDYGRWRRVVMRRHSDSVRLTYLVPPAATLAVLAGGALALTGRRVGLVTPAGYALAVVAASLITGRDLPPAVRLRLPVVFATMHHCWGAGFLTSPRDLGRT